MAQDFSPAYDRRQHRLVRLLDAIVIVLVAPECAACGAILDAPLAGAICTNCWASIRMAPRSTAGPRLRHIDALRSVGEYDGTLRAAVHALKYGTRRSVARMLGALMRDRAQDVLSAADAVVPVPLHWTRSRQRGFNQASLLAAALGVPVLHVLRRTRRTHAQVGLPAHDRRANVAGAFAVRRRDGWRCRLWKARHPVRGLSVVLVDDVTTTGATLEACAAVLKAAGAVSVTAVTAARVPTPPA